ncbi:hypothetical protein AB0J90_18380 [Micromonospora sp. NPDC049523]|uniref:hypothetical protein n=1 Tax=Micromonospora sp. NPDC049523 TaxID=3155921 RepID=UPI003416912D
MSDRFRTAVLFGAGADIGSNLIAQNDPRRDGFAITDVVTRHIDADPALAPLGPMRQLHGRLLLADPSLLGQVDVDEARNILLVRERQVRVHFADVTDDSVLGLGRFDLAIVATHRDHIRSRTIMDRFRKVAEHVIGVAENTALPGLYVPLAGADLSLLGMTSTVPDPDGGVYTLGSCQCVGWTAQLRGVLEAARLSRAGAVGLVRAEVDIVHPDTASSQFGTTGVGARREDARDNLRPGFSQLKGSMSRVPGASMLNTVSLRVLTQPPGYQVCRFFVRAELTYDDVLAGFRQAAKALPTVISLADVPIGSRAFSQSRSAATVITAPTHLIVVPDVLPGAGITQIITQAYVHNTVGYCVAVLEAGSRLLAADRTATLLPPVEVTR